MVEHWYTIVTIPKSNYSNCTTACWKSSKQYAGLHTESFTGGGGGGRGDLMDNLRMYVRRCRVYILVNKLHNNAVITNGFFLLVYVIILILCCIIILHVYYCGILGGEIPVPPPPPPLCMHATLICTGVFMQFIMTLCVLLSIYTYIHTHVHCS